MHSRCIMGRGRVIGQPSSAAEHGGGAVFPLRALNLLVGLSMIATGLLGALATDDLRPESASPVSEVARVAAGTRLTVHGIVERLRSVGKGAVISSLSDCAGNRSTVFFARGAGDVTAFSLAVLVGTAKDYKGGRELVVESAGDAHEVAAGAEILSAHELRAGWRDHLCRAVAFTAKVGWAAVSPDDPRDVEVGLPTAAGELLVVIHLDAYPALTVQPGASVSFVGVLAATPDGTRPAVHVRA